MNRIEKSLFKNLFFIGIGAAASKAYLYLNSIEGKKKAKKLKRFTKEILDEVSERSDNPEFELLREPIEFIEEVRKEREKLKTEEDKDVVSLSLDLVRDITDYHEPNKKNRKVGSTKTKSVKSKPRLKKPKAKNKTKKS